jgi:hypothetical protein
MAGANHQLPFSQKRKKQVQRCATPVNAFGCGFWTATSRQVMLQKLELLRLVDMSGRDLPLLQPQPEVLDDPNVRLYRKKAVSACAQTQDEGRQRYAKLARRHSAADFGPFEKLLNHGKVENALRFQHFAMLPPTLMPAKRNPEFAAQKISSEHNPELWIILLMEKFA